MDTVFCTDYLKVKFTLSAYSASVETDLKMVVASLNFTGITILETVKEQFFCCISLYFSDSK
jgi:hypothetical protein